MKLRKLLAFLATLVLTACGTFDVNVERTPTLDGVAATAKALATDDARFHAQVVVSATAIRLTAQAAPFSATLVPTATGTRVILTVAPTLNAIPIPTVIPSLKPTFAPATVQTHTPSPPPISGATSVHPLTTPVACAYSWFFLNSPAECPGQAPIYSLTVAQHFEHGLMLWREQPGPYGSQIYAFFTDNQWPYVNPTNDRWRPGMPESDPSVVPPPGYYQPVRGFGEFWRPPTTIPQGTNNIVLVRDRLGWATDEEFSLGELPMQCHIPDSYLNGCFLVGPDKAIYAIYPDNNWSLWDGSTPVPSR
jgi:hypothetical protein